MASRAQDAQSRTDPIGTAGHCHTFRLSLMMFGADHDFLTL
jgi:hypothetical protein